MTLGSTFYGFPVIQVDAERILLSLCPWCEEEKARADAMEGTRYHGATVRFTSRAHPECLQGAFRPGEAA